MKGGAGVGYAQQGRGVFEQGWGRGKRLLYDLIFQNTFHACVVLQLVSVGPIKNPIKGYRCLNLGITVFEAGLECRVVRSEGRVRL